MTKQPANNPFAGSVLSGKERSKTLSSTGNDRFGAAFLHYAQEQIDKTVHTAQQLLNCRSFEEAKSIQSQFMQQSFDRLVKEASKMTQTAAHMAKETVEPLSNRMENFIQKSMGRTS